MGGDDAESDLQAQNTTLWQIGQYPRDQAWPQLAKPLCYPELMKYILQFRKICVLLLLMVGLTATRTWAQGTDEAFPDPIDSKTLEQWMEGRTTEGGSSSHSMVWGPCLDRYQARFRMLREGIMEAWLASDSTQDGNDAEGAERLSRERRAILAGIRDLDETLAAEITVATGEDDPFRIRLSNRLARRRALSVCRRLGAAKIALDLIDQVHSVEPSEEMIRELTPLLTSWDAEMRRELESITETMLDLDVERARLKLGSFRSVIESDDPDTSWMEWHEAREALLDDRYKALARLSRRTVELARGMEPILEREKHDLLMERILPRLYGPSLSGKSDLPATFKKAADRLDAIEDEEEIQSLEELENGWRVARREVTDELLDVVSSRRNREMFMISSSEEQQLESTRRMTRIRQLRTDRKELDERFRKMVYAMMGEPLPPIETSVGAASPMDTMLEGLPAGFAMDMEMLETDGMMEGEIIFSIAGSTAAGSEETDALMAELMENGIGGDAAPGVIVLSHSMTGEDDMGGMLEEITGALQNLEILPDDMIDEATSSIAFDAFASFPFRPRAMSTKRILDFAEAEGLSEAQKMIITLLHEDYVTLYEIQSELWSRDQIGSLDEDMQNMMERQLDVMTGNDEVRRTLQQIDLDFLTDLDTTLSGVVSDDSIRRFIERRQRDFHRSSLTGRGQMQPWIPASGAPMAELETLAESFGLEDDENVSELLGRWHQEATPLLIKLYDSRMEAGRVEATTMFQAMMKDNWSESDFGTMVAAHERSNRMSQQLADLNAATVKEIAAMQDASRSSEVLHAWRRMIWPSVYEDALAERTGLALEIAGVMSELTANQIAGIMALETAYESEYETLSIEMIESRERLENAGMEDERNMTTAMRDYERIKFERDELNARTIRDLEEVVGAELADQLKGQATSLGRTSLSAPTP